MARGGQDFNKYQEISPYSFPSESCARALPKHWKLTPWQVSQVCFPLHLTKHFSGVSGHWAFFPSQGHETGRWSHCQDGKSDLTEAPYGLPLWPSCWKDMWHLEVVREQGRCVAPQITLVVIGSTEAFEGLFHSIFSHACHEVRNTFMSLTFNT